MNQEEALNDVYEEDFLLKLLKNTTKVQHTSDTDFSVLKFEKIASLANLHGIIPQVHKALKDTEFNNSEALKQVIQKSYKNILQANLLLTANLLTVSKTLEAHQFNYISIKGPTLAHELYKDISMRQFSDIDLFVDEKDIYQIAELLLSIGYKPLLPLSLLKRKKFLALDNDFSFRHTKNNALLELHWKLFPLRHKMPLDFKELYTASKTLQLQNREINTLSTEDNLLYLSLHGAKHIFERYEWVYDLHTLIHNNPDLDLERIYLKAKREQLEIPFLLGIFMSHTLFETKIPKSFHSYQTEHIQSLITKTLSYYKEGFVHWDESDKKRARFLFLSELFQNKETKILWLFKSLFKTTPVDVITFNLPDSLAFLYPLLRPFRLTYKHLFTKKPQYV